MSWDYFGFMQLSRCDPFPSLPGGYMCYTIEFPSASVTWSGIFNDNAGLYPINLEFGASITFMARYVSSSLRIRFRFEDEPLSYTLHYETSDILIDTSTYSSYSVDIPATPDGILESNSFILYINELDRNLKFELYNIFITENPPPPPPYPLLPPSPPPPPMSPITLDSSFRTISPEEECPTGYLVPTKDQCKDIADSNTHLTWGTFEVDTGNIPPSQWSSQYGGRRYAGCFLYNPQSLNVTGLPVQDSATTAIAYQFQSPLAQISNCNPIAYYCICVSQTHYPPLSPPRPLPHPHPHRTVLYHPFNQVKEESQMR